MPEHKTYGIINNSFYILGKIKQYQPRLLLIILVGGVADSLTQYLPSFIGKFVIDIVQMQAASPDKNIIPLLKLLIITTVIDLTVSIVRLLTYNIQWFNFTYVRMHMITERVSKALSMNYQMLEQPKILDMHQKALRATDGNDNGVEGVMQSIYAFGVQVVTMVITLSAVMILNWRIILILSALSIVQYLFFRYTVKKDKRKVWDMLAPTWRKLDYMANTTQNFGYAKDIRLFGMKDWLLGRHHKILMDKQEKMLYSRNLWIYNSGFSHVISMLSTAAVYGILFFTVIDKNMYIGNFTLYLGLCTTFTSSMTEFLNAMGEFKKRSLQVDDYRSFMDLKTEEDGDFLPVPDGDSYTFEFKNVSFKYEGSETYALKNLNLTLHAGEKLAIVGHNGAGKTTFIKLLLRLYDVTEGEILLNGVDIRRFRRDEYYRLFSPVFQNVEVFAFPIAENVSMKRPVDTDKELAKECLVKAGMSEKIESLANGVDTQLLKIVDDGGVDFSGGEKQKLALARALYKNAPVIILDEPTAALDALAEYNLYKNFNDIVANKSAVYISHRLSSTRFCDIIAMFKDGGMIEYGTHEELLNKGGAYAEMFEIQAQYYREKEAYENV
ncbi:MAG: ABC transporter ATP-binding protein/permease [Butyrivibrio sp.]|nr:ABC transporter ATP-binding protein/permease [Butyrivibrio sp.]